MTRFNGNKNIIVSSESQGLYTTKRFLIEAKKLKYKSTWINPYNSSLDLTKSLTLSGLFFHRTSGVRYDEFDTILGQFHQDSGMKITNPLPALKTFRNKDEQALFFNKHQLPCLPTLLFRGQLHDEFFQKVVALSKNEQYVLKMVRGNQGIGVNLINGTQSLKSLLETFGAIKDQRFLLQPFIEHKKQWRVFFIKDELIAVIERDIKKDDFRGNSKRAKAKLLKKIPAELTALGQKAFKSSGLDYCGIDILEENGIFKILEINAVPGFREAEELSGINIARELIVKLY